MIVLALALCTALAPSKPAIDVKEALGALFSPPPDPEPLLTRLRAAEASATGRERALVGRTIKLIETTHRQAAGTEPPSLTDMQTQLTETAQLLRDFIELTLDDVATQRTLVATFPTLAVTAANLGIDRKPLEKESLARARQLVKHFPKDGRSHGVLASALAHNDADWLEIGKSYKTCAELDPAAEHCAQGLADARAALQAQRCSKLKAGFAIHGATQQGTAALEPKPVITASDVATTTLGNRGVQVQLTPAGAKKLEAATQRLVTAGGWMTILANGEQLLSARVMQVLHDGRVQISGGKVSPAELLTRLCESVETPALPAALL